MTNHELTAADLENHQDLLPANIVEFKELIGSEATAKLINKFGGTHISVRMGRTASAREANAPIYEAVGKEAAEKIIDFFGKYHIAPYIPKCNIVFQMARKQKAIERYDHLTGKDGMTGEAAIKMLAREFGLSQRHLHRIVNGKTRKNTPPRLQRLAAFPDFASAAEFVDEQTQDNSDFYRLLIDDTATDGTCTVYRLKEPKESR